MMLTQTIPPVIASERARVVRDTSRLSEKVGACRRLARIGSRLLYSS